MVLHKSADLRANVFHEDHKNIKHPMRGGIGLCLSVTATAAGAFLSPQSSVLSQYQWHVLRHKAALQPPFQTPIASHRNERLGVTRPNQYDSPAVHTPTDDDGTLLGISPILWLNGVAILWGSQHAVIKTILMDSDDSSGADPTVLLLLRFGLAAGLALLPIILNASTVTAAKQSHDDDATINDSPSTIVEGTDGDTDVMRTESIDNTTSTLHLFNSNTWRWGLELGIFMFLGFFFQAIGLQYTTAQKSGFLLYLNVKLVPFFALALYGRTISTITWLSALVAFVGTALLATGGSASSSWNVGDAWTIAAAAASAMFILRLEEASRPSQRISATDLNAASLVVVAALSAVWLFVAAPTTSPSIYTMAASHPWELLYLGGVTTALSNWIQTRAQRYVPAERAALIYSLDPVYGAGFAYLLLGEELATPAAVLGAALITVAAGTNAYLEFNKKEE